jgi:AraC-like DNA-binding protein
MTGWAAALRDPAIGAVLADLHTNPSYPWTVEALGRRAGLSRAAFARRFHQLVGQPPLTYLTWWRMSLAARMLRESTVSNSAVARRLGYASELSFGRAFKRHHGVSPGSFRQAR